MGAQKCWAGAEPMKNYHCPWCINVPHSEVIEKDGSKPASLSGRKPDLGFGPSKPDGFPDEKLGVGAHL